MENYEKLLERAYERLPKRSDSGERFQIPKSKILPAGARTVIINFVEIANTLRRDPQHIQKFLLKELATSGELQGNRLVVQGKFRSDIIDRKIELYVKEYVICPECGKPDTKLVKEDRYLFLVCEACGSKHIVKKI